MNTYSVMCLSSAGFRSSGSVNGALFRGDAVVASFTRRSEFNGGWESVAIVFDSTQEQRLFDAFCGATPRNNVLRRLSTI